MPSSTAASAEICPKLALSWRVKTSCACSAVVCCSCISAALQKLWLPILSLAAQVESAAPSYARTFSC